MLKCEVCNEMFEVSRALNRHCAFVHKKMHTSVDNKRIVKRYCRFCNQEFDNTHTLACHTPYCKLNPKLEVNKAARKDGRKNVKHSDETRKKISLLISEKVKNGTWHCSFSKSRTHEYKNVKFHRKWELKFAMFLDNLNIEWIRTKRKFPYTFENKRKYYTPDFWLPEFETFIEIKGHPTLKDKEKWMQFKEKLLVISGKDLIELEILNENDVKIHSALLVEKFRSENQNPHNLVKILKTR